MRQPGRDLSGAGRRASLVGAILCVFCAFVLLLTSQAEASFERVGGFDEAGNFQLQVPSGIAVNATGSGGVPVGTIYTVDEGESPLEPYSGVVSYDAKGEFREAWGWGVADKANEFQRCGPDGEAAHPTCPSENSGKRGEGAGQIWGPKGVAVDQATGDVYVYNFDREKGAVQIFTAGGERVGGFGENAPAKSSIDESPEKFHAEGFLRNQIAVDDSGTVYVSDLSLKAGGEASRVMVFKPHGPGDYEHYEYTGRANDIDASTTSAADNPESLAVDTAGDLYVSSSEFIREFSPAESAIPVCEYKAPGGQVGGMTVNAKRAEVFYLSKTNEKFHQLACGLAGKFVEKSAFPLPAGRASGGVLAFDPALARDETRPVGILYYASTRRGVDIFAPSEIRPPQVETESVSAVGFTSAALGAQINPDGSQTRYVFQYLPKDTYEANGPGDRFAGAADIPLGGAVLGSGQEVLGAGTTLAGLQADTTYFYRVIASSPCNPEEEEVPCESVGLSSSFHTFPSEAGELPDHRAYEMVSPVLKDGSEVLLLNPRQAEPPQGGCKECNRSEFSVFPKQSAPDGDSVVYEGGPFSGGGGGVEENEYLSRRTASGWQTTNLTPERLQTTGEEAGFKAFDTSLGKGLLAQLVPSLTPEAPSEYANLYAFSSAAPTDLAPIVTQATDRSAPEFALTYAGATPDLSHVLFEANDALTPETPFAPEAVDPGSKKNNLYESVDGELRLVNVLPGNNKTTPGATFGSGTRHPDTEEGYAFDNAISDDGSRVFWSSESGQVYVRENSERTREIPDHAGKFITASADGSEVLLSDGTLYDLETTTETDLTQGKGGFQGIAGQSKDLSAIYFVDTAVLSEAGNGRGEVAQSAHDNLYLFRSGTVSFIATLESNDNKISGGLGTVGDWRTVASYRSAEASPDGRYLAFMSRAPLTGVDSTGPCSFGNNHPEPCEEAFLYDSATGALSCPSCNPNGSSPLGNSALPLNDPDASAAVPFFRHQTRYLIDSGRLYFDSVDSLSPLDTNKGVEDTYEYEPQGVGNCVRSVGCVDLISSGRDAFDSNFVGIDESGRNVFFTTRDQLVPKDKDGLIDLYDAREGGGFPSEMEAGHAECSGESCQPFPNQPNGAAPASLSFEGPGDLTPPPPLLKMPVKPGAKSSTSTQKLLLALRTCKSKPSKRKRAACEKTARKHYGPKQKPKHTTKKRGR